MILPHRGGTFSVFRSLRDGLRAQGISLDWLASTSSFSQLVKDPVFEACRHEGKAFDTSGKKERQVAEEMLAHVEKQSFNTVFVNILTANQDMSLAAYLPPAVRRIGIVHNITPGTYSAAKALRPYLHAAVGVSPRIEEDLVAKCGFSAESTTTIPNAIDLVPYAQIVPKKYSSPLRLLSLGRIIDIDKGVFWLPEILNQLFDLPLHLTIAGEGADLPELKNRCASLAGRVTFLGRVAPEAVPELIAAHDMLLMPSRFEGFGFTLIEAMAGRCVPIASRIRGVTDFVVQQERTGLLFPIGDTRAAAAAIRKLTVQRSLLTAYADAGCADVHARFSTDQMAKSYLDVMHKTLASTKEVAPPPNKAGFEVLPIGGGWRKFIPNSLKNSLRTWMYRR